MGMILGDREKRFSQENSLIRGILAHSGNVDRASGSEGTLPNCMGNNVFSNFQDTVNETLH